MTMSARLRSRASLAAATIRDVLPSTSPTTKFSCAMTQRSCVAWLKSFPSFEPLCDGGTHFRGRVHGGDAGSFECGEFRCRRTLSARHDGTRMTHAFAGRRRDSRDVGNHGFAYALANKRRCGLFVAAADLAHHHDALGLWVIFEQRQDIDEVHAAHGVAAYSDAGALAQSIVGGLEYRLVGQGPRARDDADSPLFMNEARHDADLACFRRNDARPVMTSG